MTTYLDWRTEPMTDVPSVSIKPGTRKAYPGSIECPDVDTFRVICDYIHCPPMIDFSDDLGEAEEIKSSHIEWHEEGCPRD